MANPPYSETWPCAGQCKASGFSRGRANSQVLACTAPPRTHELLAGPPKSQSVPITGWCPVFGAVPTSLMITPIPCCVFGTYPGCQTLPLLPTWICQPSLLSSACLEILLTPSSSSADLHCFQPRNAVVMCKGPPGICAAHAASGILRQKSNSGLR